jgi:hypothetical protein
MFSGEPKEPNSHLQLQGSNLAAAELGCQENLQGNGSQPLNVRRLYSLMIQILTSSLRNLVDFFSLIMLCCLYYKPLVCSVDHLAQTQRQCYGSVTLWERLQIRILGSVPLINGSGSGSCSYISDLKVFLPILHRKKVIKSHNTKKIKDFLTISAWWQKDPDPNPNPNPGAQKLTDPDP